MAARIYTVPEGQDDAVLMGNSNTIEDRFERLERPPRLISLNGSIYVTDVITDNYRTEIADSNEEMICSRQRLSVIL